MNILIRLLFLSVLSISLINCSTKSNQQDENPQESATKYPSDVMPSLDQWRILLGNGESESDLKDFEHKDYFYTANDGTDWVVYKAPNGGITSPNSHNTRTELGQKARWTPRTGGKLTGTLKVMHVSTSGDARIASSFSVVVGQIHSADGHKNEPLKIFYKKFPGHAKGSVFWNYEINTAGDNSKRWDYSTAVWGYDMSGTGTAPDAYPAEPEDGIELGEEFSYEVNVHEGMMHLTFKSEGHETKTFTKNLLASEYLSKSDIPQQVLTLYSAIGRDGTERPNAYEGELQFFKQGAYNQTNGRDPATNMVWSSGAATYDGDVAKQYENGSYAEVWFRESSVGPGTYASDVIPFFNHWNLILGDGSNAGQAINYEHKDFFYTAKDNEGGWVVFKAPNSGDTHGTSNNTRTELAQLRKWSPMTDAKLTAELKVMNVSATGDARVAASYSVVVGQIHSADGHENEPLKIFYKKFPGHTKGSVFWHYEINTAGEDNSGRWDHATAVWGYDFSVVGTAENTYPEEPEEGIALGEAFRYDIEVKDGVMYLTFTSEGHETKTFTKNLIKSEYTTTADIPKQTQELFVPIGQDGVERENAYADEGLFFKLGSYNQTNGKSPEVNKNWCSGAEIFGGDIQKQYETGNYAEVWFKTASIFVSDQAISNEGYFLKND